MKATQQCVREDERSSAIQLSKEIHDDHVSSSSGVAGMLIIWYEADHNADAPLSLGDSGAEQCRSRLQGS